MRGKKEEEEEEADCKGLGHGYGGEHATSDWGNASGMEDGDTRESARVEREYPRIEHTGESAGFF